MRAQSRCSDMLRDCSEDVGAESFNAKIQMAAGVARSEAARAAKAAKAAVAQPAARGFAVSRISVAVVRLILPCLAAEKPL